MVERKTNFYDRLCIKAYWNLKKEDRVFAIYRIQKLKIIDNGLLKPYIVGSNSELPRQDLKDCYKLNGAFYLTKIKHFMNNKGLHNPPIVPYIMEDYINLDTKHDLEFLEYRLDKKNLFIWCSDEKECWLSIYYWTYR